MRLLDGGFSQSRKRGRKKRERDLTRQEYLDSIATSTAFIPGLGDIAEFGSLANREYEGVDKPAWWEYALATVPGGIGAAAGLIPKRYYHGRGNTLDELKPTPHDENGIMGISVSSDPEVANRYASVDERLYRDQTGRLSAEDIYPNVVPIDLDGDVVDYMDFADDAANHFGIEFANIPDEDLISYAKSKGISGFDYDGVLGDKEVQIIDPSKIRYPYDKATVPSGLGAVGAAAGLIAKRTGKLADDTMPEKITAYHGSPHDFDKFKMSQVGTGEGAQAYGHGLYFAESEDVARGYRDALTELASKETGEYVPQGEIYDVAMNVFGDDYRAGNKAASRWLYGNNSPASAKEKELFDLLDSRYSQKQHMYQVEIDASPDELLDWDLPLSEQSDIVQKAFPRSEGGSVVQLHDGNWAVKSADGVVDPVVRFKAKEGAEDYLNHSGSERNPTGESLLDSYYDEVGNSPGAAEAALREKGIKGIRYKDGFSRDKEGGTSNYVIFDENIISIAKKYGLAIPAAAALYGNMTGQDASSLYSEEAVGRLGEANET